MSPISTRPTLAPPPPVQRQEAPRPAAQASRPPPPPSSGRPPDTFVAARPASIPPAAAVPPGSPVAGAAARTTAPATATAPATTLLTEDIRDGSANCLDKVGDWLDLASPQIRGRTEVLFLRDTRPGAEGQSGHVVLRQGEGIFDPTTGRSYPSFQAFNAQGNYEIAHAAGGSAMAKVLSAPPGSAERAKAIAAARLPPEVQGMLVADGDPAGGPSPEQLAALAQLDANAEAAWATLPADHAGVMLSTTDPGAIVSQWEQAARQLLGPGDAGALDGFLSAGRRSMESVARLLQPNPAPGSDGAAYALHLQSLAAANPGATFQLVAVQPGTVFNATGEMAQDVVVAMIQPDGTVQHFALPDPQEMNNSADWTHPALWNNDELRGRFYQQFQSMADEQGWTHYDYGDSKITFNMLASDNPGAINQVVQAMSPEDQRAILQAYGGPQGLMMEVDVSPDDVIASADATHLVTGQAPAEFSSAVNVSGAGLNKTARFLDQNYDAVVAPTFSRYATLRGDAPRPLSGADLVNEIGASMNMAPDHVPTTEEEWAQLEAGTWPLFGGETAAAIEPIAGAIRSVGGEPAQVTVLPIMFDSPDAGLVQLPLYRVEGTDGQTHFVDNVGRTYSSLQDWKDNNKLPPGRVTYPADGHLAAGADGRAATVTEPTHAVVDTPGEVITQVLDTAALVGGFVVGAAAIIGTGGAAIPVAMGAMAAWGTYRSVGSLVDRANHGQSIDPFSSPEARMEWLNLGANALGFAALSAGPVARVLVNRGSAMAGAAVEVAAWLNVGSQVASTATMANLGLTLVTEWDNLSADQRANMVLQLGFWGGMTAHAANQAGGLRNLYSASAIRNQLVETAADVWGLHYPSESERAARQTQIEADVAQIPMDANQEAVLGDIQGMGISPVDVWQGSHVVVDGDGGALYNQWVEMGAQPRVSSHYPGVESQQYEIRFGDSALLFGTDANGNTWFQMEAHSIGHDVGSIMGDPGNAMGHMMDYVNYRGSRQNVGPMGLSPYTDANPLLAIYRP